MASAISRLLPWNKKLDPEKEGLVLLKSFRQKSRFFAPAFAVVDDETILVASKDGSVFLFSLRSGDRLQAYRDIGRVTQGVELLGNGIFARVGYPDISAHDISDGTELARFKYKNQLLFYRCSASLGDSRFLVGTSDGEVLEMRWSNTDKLLHNRTVNRSRGGVKMISVCKDRFAVGSWGSEVVPVFETTGFERVGAVKVKLTYATSVHLTDRFLVIGCRFGEVFVYNSLTFELVREIRNHAYMDVVSVHVMDDERHLLSAGGDGLICLQDTETGVSIWQKHFRTPVERTTLLPDGRLVAGFASGSIVVLEIPRDLENAELVVPPPAPPTPIRDAFESCISGAGKPSEKCEEVISYDKCRESFGEWCCAHQLLMMAVEDGDISRSRDYNGKISWWFKNLYLAAKDIPTSNDDDIQTIERFLVEAKKVGVVEGIETVLGDRKVTEDMNAEVRALQRADILLLERLMTIEVRLENLKQSFERYRKYARNSQLIGVALQIIPIAGGSIAGVISAGADIIEGLSTKDLTDYFLGLGSNLLQDEASSMSDRVFRGAARALSQEQLDKMNVDHRRKLEEMVESWGLSVERLRELFIERARHEMEVECEENMMCGSDVGEDAAEVIVEEEELAPPMLEYGTCEDGFATTGTTERETDRNADVVVDRVSEVTDTFSLDRPSAWKDFNFDKDVIRGLRQEQLASLCAAYIVRNEDERREEFDVMRDCLESVLEKEHLFSEVILDGCALPSDELVEIVTSGMEKDGMLVTAGIRAKVRQFVSVVRRND